jgi:transcriptional regulator with XRE-family HTH domain
MGEYKAGARIREMRRARNMTREQLAVTAGVSVTTINRVEQGTRIGLKSLAAILAVIDPEARITDYAE